MSPKPTEQYAGPDRREKEEQGWHLDRKVPLSLIFAMLVQAGGVVWAIADIKKDVEVLKMQTTSEALGQRERDRRQDDQATAAILLIRSQLERMENKMDRIIEGRNR